MKLKMTNISGFLQNTPEEVKPHSCFCTRKFILYEKEAFEQAIEETREALSRRKGYFVGRGIAREVIMKGLESELDEFVDKGQGPLNPLRNFFALAIGYRAGHCGYTCPDKKGCEESKLWTGQPNYLQEDPEMLKKVFENFCSGIYPLTMDEKDAIIRCLVEHKYLQSKKAHRDIGLENAEKDFEFRFNKFFFKLGFELGHSEEYGAFYRIQKEEIENVWLYHSEDEGASQIGGDFY